MRWDIYIFINIFNDVTLLLRNSCWLMVLSNNPLCVGLYSLCLLLLKLIITLLILIFVVNRIIRFKGLLSSCIIIGVGQIPARVEVAACRKSDVRDDSDSSDPDSCGFCYVVYQTCAGDVSQNEHTVELLEIVIMVDLVELALN